MQARLAHSHTLTGVPDNVNPFIMECFHRGLQELRPGKEQPLRSDISSRCINGTHAQHLASPRLQRYPIRGPQAASTNGYLAIHQGGKE